MPQSTFGSMTKTIGVPVWMFKLILHRIPSSKVHSDKLSVAVCSIHNTPIYPEVDRKN